MEQIVIPGSRIGLSSWLLLSLLFVTVSSGTEQGLVAWWSFDEQEGGVAVDSVGQIRDAISGNFMRVEGARRGGMRFDGYTTYVTRKAKEAPSVDEAFTIETWVALQTYPWNWTAIVNQEKGHRAGYFFGIDHEGHLGLHLAVEGEWQECNSEIRIPLLKWCHVAGTFGQDSGVSISINGRPAGFMAVDGEMTPAGTADLLIGRSHTKMCPALTERTPSREKLSHMVLDGLIDEVKIYNRVLSAEEIRGSLAAVILKKQQPLTWRTLPSGPKGAGEFGAYYGNLKYCDEWDALWRGNGPDVVVRFDVAPIRLVSWRGISYNPCWVTENGNWFSNEFMERGTPMGCAESMSDKQARYSHIKILENSGARAVLYWRYSPVDIAYQPPDVDEPTSWGDWAEEYWTVYPDGVAARKVVMWSGRKPFGQPEWCQSLPIFRPGQRPEEVLDERAFLSLANMAGESCTYRWPADKPVLPGANIQIVNYKSRFKPFLILTDKNPRIWFAKFRKRKAGQEIRGMSMPLNSKFWWWNHWPVAQLPNDGRIAEFPDRPSHSYTSTQDSDPHEIKENSISKIMLCGLTDKTAAELVPLARSWLNAPELKVKDEAVSRPGFVSEGYDQSQRAYVLNYKETGEASKLSFELMASDVSPVVNPAFIVQGWGESNASLKVNCKRIARGRNFRFGHRHRLEGVDLIVWVEMEATHPVPVELTRSGK